MTLDSDAPIEGLTQAELEKVGPERLLCRNMIASVNDLVALLEKSPEADAGFQRQLDGAKNRWPRRRGRCDAAIGDLDEGWPRSVLRDEFKRVVRLWSSLIDVAEAHSSGAEPGVLEATVTVYQDELDQWRDWLDASLDFWAGAWTSERPPETCLSEATERTRNLAKKIWLLTTQPREKRTEEDLTDITIRIDTERKSLAQCTVDDPLSEVQLSLLGRRLLAYEEGAIGLREDDDARIRRAMDAEQRLVARSMRCRQEHSEGTPSAVCRPAVK
jgi:hypothetical protein